MGRIEDALKKLQTNGRPPVPRPAEAAAGPERIPAARPAIAKRKAIVEGPRHHVSVDDLTAAGLLASHDQATQVEAEFRRIKRPLIENALAYVPDDGGYMNVIMIASALPGAGKTFCAVNLALSLSLERELNVLLVDADVVKPHISREFGLGSAPGLIDVLVGDVADLGSTLVRTDLNEIQVLPAGRRHPQATELLASDRMSRVVSELALRYPDRIIIVDSPPLLATSEAQALARQVGQIALVVESGQTSRQILEQAIETLDLDKAVNLILNKNQQWGRGQYYGEAYGYQGYD